MKGAARRLAAAVEALRGGGGSAAEQQKQQQELVQALIALQRLWKPELLATPSPTKKRSAKSNAALFQLLLATLIVYSGGHTGSSNAGAAGAGTGAMGVSLSTPSAATSECVHRLVCDLLVRAFDFSVVPSINETLAAKNMSLYIKVSLVMVVCRLQPQEALQFLPDAVALANKNLRAADYYMKQCLIESVAHALDGDARRLVPFHAEALKIVTKSFQDKAPEVRVAAARLLQVVAERTSASMTASSGAGAGGSGGSQGGGSGNSSGSGAGVGGSGSAAGPGNGGSHANAQGVSLDAILQITAKGMDDVAPEARRAYSVVVGTVLAKFATSSSSGESEMQAGESNGASAASSRNNDEDAGGRPSNEHDTPPSSGSGKAKTGFKLHVPGMTGLNLPASLSRRKAATVNFSTIANVVVYFKDMVTSKYLSSNPNQSHGGILASFSIALCSMFERLPPDSIAESQLREVLDAILAILDHPFALGDLTRARNAVGFVLRYGLNGCLTERQQEVLLGAYLQKLKDEVQTADPNHHKILTALVELSHLFHSMGEASVSHARGASDVFQELTCHEKQSVRFQAAVALASLVTAIPYRLKSVLTGCLQGLRDTAEYLMRGGSDVEETRNSEPAEKAEDGQDEGNDMQSKTHLYAIQGRSAAIAHILRAIKLDAKGGLSQGIMDDIYSISEELVESQFLSECADSIWLTCTRAGWTLVGSLVAMNDETWIKANLEKLLNLWLKSSVLHSRESSLELLRIEAAVIALSSFLANCQGVAVDPDNDVNLLASHILHVYLTATQDTLSNPLKRRGQIARFRLMGWIINCFSMLPPIYSDSYIVLLDLVAEFTTAQALTNLRHSSLVPAKSTYLQSVLSSEDNALDIVTLSRLEPGDYPSPLYSRELNHLLGLLQRENALTDTELEDGDARVELEFLRFLEQVVVFAPSRFQSADLSIAIGESASTFAGAGAEQLMMSPKGLNLGIQATGNDEASGDDDTSSWSPNPTLDLPKADANSLASAAVAAQVDTWRATKASVGDLIALMPPLSRQVRHFAVECVLRVFELMAAAPPMTAGASQTKQLHFDLVAARRYFFEMLSAGAASPISTESDIGNFLCMYLDEFVTLACHVTTTSTEGDELLMFQCVGLRLLNTLVKNFASARDPEVATGDAYLLDPYRAQLSSAIRHALKQVQVEPSLLAQTMENDKGEETYFYAPLLLEAHGIAGACISAHLIQDKVGLGRILKAVVTPDYGHAHFIGDELTRTALSLANLASVAELLTSSVTEAIAQKDARDDEQRAIATSPLVKAMTNGLSGTTEYLFKCWMDMTFAYGVVMQGCAQWAQLNPPSAAALLTGEPMVMPALQLPLPPVGPTATASAAALSASKALRSLYKRYWPKIVNAMATLEAYMPKSVSLLSTYPSVLLSSAIFHVNTNARDRMEDDTELPAVLRSIPLILKALKECPSKEGGTSSSNFPVLLTTAVNSLMLASKRCSGPSQVEALKSIFLCLSRENLAFARDICCSGDDGDQGCAALFDVVAQAGLCPTEVVCSLCDASEQTRHARAVSIGSRATGSRRNSIASEEDSKHMAEVVQFATTGIVLLHTNEEARSGVVRSVALVQQAICSVASSYHSSSVKEAVVTLSRASTEAVFALARTLETNSDSGNDVLTRIKTSVRGSLEFLSEWLKVDIHSAPGFSMQIVANFAASFPTCLHDDAERFHADVAETASAVLEISPGTEDDGAKRQQLATARAELLRGLHAVVKRLVDVHQSSIANRYLVALGPSLVETVAEANGYPETAAELAELDEAEGLLRLLTTQLNDAHGAAFVHMLLPRLAAVLSNPPPSAAENAIPAQVPGILARLLLCFAQTHAAAFKEAVAAMAPTLRGVLETALRLALTGSGPAAGARASSSLSQGSGPAATKLDLSRYA
ncbi:hypothetical protein PR002_g12524 [Phytophthora rubi]|uniref:HEAT repeat-containing protein 5B n=1 Tax=Phytophthora rubi TaxID=129364 RepID=A0A6A3LQJ5_9STRA|nr:hypothetical protein PR002_g12524 [Phytophthora rubi]